MIRVSNIRFACIEGSEPTARVRNVHAAWYEQVENDRARCVTFLVLELRRGEFVESLLLHPGERRLHTRSTAVSHSDWELYTSETWLKGELGVFGTAWNEPGDQQRPWTGKGMRTTEL